MYNDDYIEFLKNEFSVASAERIKEYWDFYNSKDVSPDFVVAFESYFGIGQIKRIFHGVGMDIKLILQKIARLFIWANPVITENYIIFSYVGKIMEVRIKEIGEIKS